VISKAVPGQFVIDAGSKALTAEASSLVEGFGVIPELGNLTVSKVSEHHGIVLCNGERPAIGTLLLVVPNHICTVVNLYDHFHPIQGDALQPPAEVSARGHLT
jgi:D-serine deaminase-like pyridoxal phosphate-dependent protein